jgi:hypothetical protein
MRFATSLIAAVVLIFPNASDIVGQDRAKQDNTPKGLRVFFASHSLMWYAPTPLGELATAAGIKDHKLVGVQRLGASKTLQHWNLPDAKNEAKKALKTGAVDVFVMSPIQFPDEGIENFVKLGLEHNPNIRFTVQVSWGGWDIDNKTPHQLKKLYERNIKAAEAQADDINKKYGKGKQILCLVPSAQALVVLRTKIFNKELPGLTSQGELFRDPISHPAPPLETLNTYLHYAVIYRQSPVGLPMPGLLKNAKKKAWGEKLDRALQEIAWEVVTTSTYSGVAAALPVKNKRASEKYETSHDSHRAPCDYGTVFLAVFKNCGSSHTESPWLWLAQFGQTTLRTRKVVQGILSYIACRQRCKRRAKYLRSSSRINIPAANGITNSHTSKPIGAVPNRWFPHLV